MKRFILTVSFLSVCVSVVLGSPVPFPAFDPFTSASTSGGSSYATGATLGGQTNANGSYWYLIDSSGTAANSLILTGGSLNYLGLAAFSGNEIRLTNAAGPGGRMFVWTNNTYQTATSGNGLFQVGPLSIFYSFVMQVSNINNLSTTGAYICGFGDQGTIATQTSQPGTVSTRLYLKSVTGGYEVGIGKMATSNFNSTVFTTNQTLFIVADYEIQTADGNGTTAINGTGDIVRLWVNPATNTFGAQTQPAETLNTAGTTDANLTAYTSCFQFYDIANTANDTYITAFRMGTNWSWVTGAPTIGQQPPASTNFGAGVLKLSVLAMNNGSANSYNWQFNGANLTDGPSISGSGATVTNALTASLTISNITSLDAGSYTVAVSNAYGVVTSLVSAVTTLTSPIINAQSGSTNVVLYPGGSNTISLTVEGLPPLSYYWYSNNTLIADTNSSFTITNAQASTVIYCVVSNSLNTATSAAVTLSVVPAPTYPYPLTVFNDHPIGFWPLNEGPDAGGGDDGVTAHDYIAGNNGFYTNAILDLPGYAAGLASQYNYTPATDTNTSAEFGYFNFPNSYVAQIPNINFASSGAGGSSFSVEAWANGNGAGEVSGAAIVGKGFGNGGEQFTLDYTTGWRFYVRNAAGTTIAALSTNTIDSNWHHLVGVVDMAHGNVTLYVDGEMRATNLLAPSGGILTSAYPVAIGSRQSSSSSVFNNNFVGYIEDVAIYNYALTAAQVSNHYNVAGIGPTVILPSSTNVNEGTTLTLAAVITGTPPLSYQWYNANNYSAPLVGQTNATLVISNILAAQYNGVQLELTASNAYGQGSAYLQLGVLAGPPNSVTITPQSRVVYSESPTPFTVTAQGTTPYSYQWFTNGGTVAGATNSIYSPSLPPGSYTIGCALSNAYGAGSPPIVTASLTVVQVPTDKYAATILNDGPLAFWRLDESSNSTTAYDYVGGHNAIYNNALSGQPGFDPLLIPSETATVFGINGPTDSEAVENDNTTNGIAWIDFSSQGVNAEFSVEMWTQSPPQTGGDLLCKGYPNNTQFAMDTDGSSDLFRFVVHNAADSIQAVNTPTAPDGNWHHLVGVCDQANGAIYIYQDGVRISTGSIPPGSGILSLANASYPVVIGAQEGQGGASYAGATNNAMSQVAIYAYALSSNQVAAHYAAGTSLPPLSPFSITSWVNIGGTNLILNWLSAPNYTYQIQTATSLAGTNNWTNFGSPVIATGTNTSHSGIVTNAPGAAGYFRVVGY